MAKPRVFISSTYYDLKHIRAALGNFIDSLGFESIMNERGSIPYSHTEPLDESCYEEVKQCDIMVLIIGSRYGSERSGEHNKTGDFFSRYQSVTRQECETALREGIPLYVFIEKAVYFEFQTYLENRDSTNVNYAHVSSVNIFEMIQEIEKLPLNNVIKPFEHYHEIEDWLRSQWAGLFRELLRKKTAQEQLDSLSAQVSLLSESNKTLKRYLETVMEGTNPADSRSIIDEESQRLEKNRLIERLKQHHVSNKLLLCGISPEDVLHIIKDSNSIRDFTRHLKLLKDEGKVDLSDNKNQVSTLITRLEGIIKSSEAFSKLTENAADKELLNLKKDLEFEKLI